MLAAPSSQSRKKAEITIKPQHLKIFEAAPRGPA
jgi:hypothetical protein